VSSQSGEEFVGGGQTQEAAATKTVLQDVTIAAEEMMAQEKSTVKAEDDAGGILSPHSSPTAPSSATDAMVKLQVAIGRARRILD